LETEFTAAVATAAVEYNGRRDPLRDFTFLHHMRQTTLGGYLSFRVRERAYADAAKSTPVLITALTRSGYTVTVTAVAHGMAPGDLAIISGVTHATVVFNGDWTVVTVADADTFTYTHTGTGTVNSGVTYGSVQILRRYPYTSAGDSIPIANQTASYACRIPNFHGILEVTLNRTDGTHDVWLDEATGGSGFEQATGRLIPLLASATKTASGSGAMVTGFSRWSAVYPILTLTDAQDAADDLLDVYVDGSPDGGTTWYNVGHFPQILGNGDNAITYRAAIEGRDGSGLAEDITADAPAGTFRSGLLFDAMRPRWGIASVSGAHSFTFKVDLYGKTA
jgi:hypothetical protein